MRNQTWARVRALISALFLLLIFGCVSPTTKRTDLDPELVRQEQEIQKQLVIRKDLEYYERLQRVSLPILRAAAPLCGENVAPRLGVQFANIYAYDKNYREAAQAVLGLDDRVQIVSVTSGSIAEQIGLLKGDILLRVNDDDVPTGKKAIAEASKIAARSLASDDPASIEVLRRGQRIVFGVPDDVICRFSTQLLYTDELNAYADGNAIYVTRGMMRFADDDEQLALIIGHELAHNSQEHIKAKTTNFFIGSIFDVAAAVYGVNTQSAFGKMGAGAYSQEFESEADYVGLYMVALAGGDISEAADFWRGFGAEMPGSITKAYGASHPSTAERFLAINDAVEEIRVKQAANIELRPEYED